MLVYWQNMRLGEKKLIQRIRRAAAGARSGVVTGIGDDCAVLRIPSGHEVLVTTDFSIEEVHFRRDWHPPELVGWRCLTRGLSDIAAMGGEPLAAFLSLAVAGDVPQKWVDRFLRGLLELAKKFGISLAERRHGAIGWRDTGRHSRGGVGASGDGSFAIGS